MIILAFHASPCRVDIQLKIVEEIKNIYRQLLSVGVAYFQSIRIHIQMLD